jgi:hypothetical protein
MAAWPAQSMKIGKGWAAMPLFSVEPPAIRIVRLDEPSFAVECREAGWFSFITPELGQECWYTSYEYPGPRFWERRSRVVRRRAYVHDALCFEIQGRNYGLEGDLQDENAHFCKVDRGYLRSYAFVHSGEEVRITTWKDNDFEKYWGWQYDPGKPVRIVDVGRWRWLDDAHFTDGGPSDIPSDVHSGGAGVWEVHIGQRAHRCLRVLEPGKSGEDIMAEAFVTAEGRAVLARRYNGSRWRIDAKHYQVDGKPQEWTERLPDAPRLYYRDICFVLWDFSIPDHAL